MVDADTFLRSMESSFLLSMFVLLLLVWNPICVTAEYLVLEISRLLSVEVRSHSQYRARSIRKDSRHCRPRSMVREGVRLMGSEHDQVSLHLIRGLDNMYGRSSIL